jgi:hypothetical protein
MSARVAQRRGRPEARGSRSRSRPRPGVPAGSPPLARLRSPGTRRPAGWCRCGHGSTDSSCWSRTASRARPSSSLRPRAQWLEYAPKFAKALSASPRALRKAACRLLGRSCCRLGRLALRPRLPVPLTQRRPKNSRCCSGGTLSSKAASTATAEAPVGGGRGGSARVT